MKKSENISKAKSPDTAKKRKNAESPREAALKLKRKRILAQYRTSAILTDVNADGLFQFIVLPT